VTWYSTVLETVGIRIVERHNCLLCIQLDLPNIYSCLIKIRSLTHWGIVLVVGMNTVKAVMDWCRHPIDTPAERPLPPLVVLCWQARDSDETDIDAVVVQWFHWLVCHWDAWWSLPPCPGQSLSRFHFTNARIVNICTLCWQHVIVENDSSSILRLGRCIWKDHGLLGCDTV